MNPDLGRYLSIRSTAYIAGNPVPFFWPMREFIAHNPLHGLEHMPFADALRHGAKLFRADTFLTRKLYQDYLRDGEIQLDAFRAQIATFVQQQPALPGVNLSRWAKTLLKQLPDPIFGLRQLCSHEEICAVLQSRTDEATSTPTADEIIAYLHENLLDDRPIYEAVDDLYGTRIGRQVDELVIRACLDFFDEGQSVWVMPHRDEGFFSAWRAVSGWRAQSLLNRIERERCGPGETLMPEQVIDYILGELKIPRDHWTGYFTRELTRLHGWSGFIRWRANAKHYYWAQNYPGDLVDLLAIRMTLGLMLLPHHTRRKRPTTYSALQEMIATRPFETFLRLELYSGQVLPTHIEKIEKALAIGRPAAIEKVFHEYWAARRRFDAREIAKKLLVLADSAGERDTLAQLSPRDINTLIASLVELETQEGMIWLRAMETGAMNQIMDGVCTVPASTGDKRPFVQAAFCIDTRSERIRRHLENVGDYQTFGIAGFFGVPVSLIELGKGSEKHLCPALLTPKNLVLEMSAAVWTDEAALTMLEKVLHELKESVVTPFVTVEAIGLLFGFDMIGKTVAPKSYNKWRKRLHAPKPNTHLLLDKLSREQADSIVRAVQRAVIAEALVQELDLAPEAASDAIVRELREIALGNAQPDADLATRLHIDDARLHAFMTRLQTTYRVNSSFADLQMEQLGRVGFSLQEQTGFVLQALSSIGLTENFSRFVLIVGHKSTSENNPYESALDCGACGGNDGLVSARVLAQMANKHSVRRQLAKHGIKIPDDVWFLPAMHDTTTDEITLHDLELLPTTHLVYLDRLRTGLTSAARLCAQERLPLLDDTCPDHPDAGTASRMAQRNALDWSQVRPEWGLAGNAYFVIGRRDLTRGMELDGRAFLHSYDYRVDPKRRLLENILTGPLVVAQWINLQYYFSTVDNERFGSGSKVYHNVSGQFGVMSGNLSDLRTGLPSQTVMDKGRPYHQPVRLITLIEASFDHAISAIESVAAVKQLVRNGWIRMIISDPETGKTHVFDEQDWVEYDDNPTKLEKATPSWKT